MPHSQPKTALVTGAASGIGRAVVSRLGAKDIHVYAADLEAPDEPIPGAEFLHLDVRSEPDWQMVSRKIEGEHGRLDILVNNAGILREAPLVETPIEIWNQVLDVNLTGVFLGCKTMVPLLVLSDGPAIVNVASIDALRGSHGHAAYAASKGGIVSLTRALAVELSGQGIRVNAVCPGTVETPMVQEMFQAAEDPAALEAQRLSVHPLGRLSTPEEQAAAIDFLCGADASFVTGTVLSVDGGRAIR
ncbi:MAG: SDR family oxidoreductase [Alphaproteobacteria bacterium]|jgi:NAD(P)-dependent dehydrogenase (short-subunit alcohol dehydrogenase family)|nr:SDR family oxidoreductase [Alphaproteobacteria bacterium]MDP6566758.1 SDR family oxidoreductase [Alphaproteobacteria bacterium]MDP6812967.1 SDR family oxidoreductase [Alphaproteobacteria bacterium]